ncbi:MAG TPA: AbrB/MazE/SpoVT family DNA-binding domain-containing protein, partial [Ilumatobacteraceae bacterium]|nr:AbrB/MazE/SpoVT family DNA-binding domain-containing protein [Ilumatobacteraceae bacterium]
MVTIDKAGRVVIPKEVRDRLDLVPGTELDVEISRDAIVLVPERRTAARFEVIDGVAVFPAVSGVELTP